MAKRNLGFPNLPRNQKNAWEKVIMNMGPGWHRIHPPAHKRMRDAMVRKKVAEFVEISKRVVLGRLTPMGVALRDMWIKHAAMKLDRSR